MTHLPYRFLVPRTPLLTPLPMRGALNEFDGDSNQFMMHRIIIRILLAILVAVLKAAARQCKNANKQVDVKLLPTSNEDGSFPTPDVNDDGANHLDSL